LQNTNQYIILMETPDKSQIGKWGEETARTYLENNGYEILETNWHCSHKEVDIIAKIKETIVFVEVKTRTTTFINPAEAVNLQKQKLLIAAANSYMRSKGLDANVRFDIISIVKLNNSTNLEHIPDAFYPRISRRR